MVEKELSVEEFKGEVNMVRTAGLSEAREGCSSYAKEIIRAWMRVLAGWKERKGWSSEILLSKK